ncbi:hypothetical protein HAX54_014090 [Datura stramonium]|uniref:Uncharacterized protein n=1 Tax=Datura stramonium TaxID=4076 RepID=A0ABS8TQ63_DATST|nr:hypothetical protein [Datura stramonium]
MVYVEADVMSRQTKKRTFKKFSYRGVNLDALLDISTDELVKLFFLCSNSVNYNVHGMISERFEEEDDGADQEAAEGGDFRVAYSSFSPAPTHKSIYYHAEMRGSTR